MPAPQVRQDALSGRKSRDVFVELPFQEPPIQLLRMVGAALCPAVGDPFAHIRYEWADRIAENARRSGLCPPEISDDEWRTLVARAYPLHPTVLVALPLLVRQLAQNERSLFAFLTSHEPWSVQDFLASVPFHRDEAPHVYRLPHLYAYVHATLGASFILAAPVVSDGRNLPKLVRSFLNTKILWSMF